MLIIDGKAIAKEKKAEIQKQLESYLAEGKRRPGLAVIRMNEDDASGRYVRNIIRNAENLGIQSFEETLSVDQSQDDLIAVIEKLNANEEVDGIILQMPLPEQVDPLVVQNKIAADKDVEGITKENAAKLYLGNESGFAPCTPAAVMAILDTLDLELSGKNAVVIGRSNVVGKPQAMLLLNRNCTVTICHSRSKNQAEICSKADILVSAVGRAKMVDSSYTNPEQIVIDVAINTDEEGNLCGDVNFDEVKDKVKAITPVPGGVGSVTNAILMDATLTAYKNHLGIK